MGRSFPAFVRRINEDGANIKIDSSFEAEDIGLTGKEVAKYVREQLTLDREEREAWIDTQKRQVEIIMAELQEEDKKRADKIQADIQAAKIQAEAEEKRGLMRSITVIICVIIYSHSVIVAYLVLTTFYVFCDLFKQPSYSFTRVFRVTR